MSRQVDCVFGNHPYQSGTFEKYEQKKAGAERNPFIDPNEWKTHLQGIRSSFLQFCEGDPL